MLSPPDSKLGKLLQQYVCARVTTMEGIDIALFDFDRHNALYYFLMNADEQIYMRYGGRDSASSSTYLNLRSLELALQQGLELHANDRASEFPEPPPPLFPREIPLLFARTIQRGSCVECHLIGDYQLQQQELAGTLDRRRDMFRSPDIKTIGIYLEVSKGLLLAESRGAVAEAGIQAGDTITHLDGTRVFTFGDFQYHYDKVPRDAPKVQLHVERNGDSLVFDVRLPDRWWVTDLDYRHWTLDPLLYFQTEPLTREQKIERGFEVSGFAGTVTYTDPFREYAEPAIEMGDVIFGVDGVFVDELANTPELYIQLRTSAGTRIQVHVMRGEETFASTITTERQRFRK